MKKFLFLLLALPSLLFAAEIVTLTEKNYVLFDDVFSSSYVSERMIDFMSKLKTPTYVEAIKNKIKKPIVYIILNSPGGEIESGLEFIQFLNSYSEVEIKTITLTAISMGFHTVQGISGERLILPFGTLMTHSAKGGFGTVEFGQPGSQMDNRYGYWLRRLYKLDENIVKRSNRLTMLEYRDLMENEYWCEGQDCVDKGLADRVVNVKCSQELKGFKQKQLTLNFMGTEFKIDYKKPNCPLAYPFDLQITMGEKKTSLYDENIVTDKMREFVLNKIMPIMNDKLNFSNGRN